MQWIKKIFSGEQTQLLTDFSQVGTDIHSHLIPSVDDGANSLEVSVEMIRGLAALGYKRLIATPHVMNDYYKNTGESIRKGLEILREAVLLEKIPVEMDAAAEY
ncbi:MAG: capsular biosynthesis protein, partial [Bacteroidetes bacterium]|nr:capsular biosynthesis protein [Bacteroidota bacterium]